MTAQSLTEFLLARIAEDEAEVVVALGYHNSDHDDGDGDRCSECSFDCAMRPSQVLAECAAKRAIVAIHRANEDVGGLAECSRCADCCTYGDNEWPCDTIRALAAVYADHADYRQEWKL